LKSDVTIVGMSTLRFKGDNQWRYLGPAFTMRCMTTSISLMLAVEDTSVAAKWYIAALGGNELWSLGSVRGLEIGGAPLFLHESTDMGFESPVVVGSTTVRVEVFVDDPDVFIEKAIAGGATVISDGVQNHRVPWGVHRQGGFTDPFGHVWLVGDRSPLQKYSSQP